MTENCCPHQWVAFLCGEGGIPAERSRSLRPGRVNAPKVASTSSARSHPTLLSSPL